MDNFSSDTMERPPKRPRLSSTNESPHEETADWDLHAARAQNDLNLKSIFEGIFSKYGRDFTEEGDEIDLQTGEIIVDNGHLLGLQEDDKGEDETAQAWLHEAARDEENGLDLSTEDSQGQDVYEDLSYGSDQEKVGAPVPGDEADVGFSSDLEPVGPESRKQDLSHEVQQDILEELDKVAAPADPLWQAPDLPEFSTPTAKTRRAQGPPKLPNLHREPSPPGSGSLWAVPKRGRPATEGKPRATPSKTRPRAKRKHHSSPVAYDWSFAATPDGDDSDDPLQELQPSPSVLRLKTKNMHGTPVQSRTRTDSPLSRKNLPVPSKTNSPEIYHDQSATYTIHDQENMAEQDHAPSHVASTKPYSLNDSTLSRTVGPSPETTPGKSRRPLTLSELKLLVRMRYLDRKKWKDINDQFPGRALNSLVVGYQRHWRDRCENPPQLSAPWSQDERQALHRLKDQVDLQWAQVKDTIPHRTQAEIEFEILCLCVRDKVWSAQQGTPDHGEDDGNKQEIFTPGLSNNTTNAEDTEDDPFVYKKLSGIQRSSRDNDDPFTTLGSSDSEGSKLSKIRLDSPAISRHDHTPSRRSPAKQLNFVS